MKDVCIKDPISMLIPIHFYFLLSEQQEMSHTFLLSISLCICCPFTVVLLLLCFYSPFQPLQYLLYSSVYCMCWHFFVHVCFYFIFRVSSPHAFPASFLCFFFFRVHQMPDTHQLISSYLISFSCSLACLLLSSWLSSLAALSFHFLSFTVNCILSLSCLLPRSLFIPSSHLFSKSFHLLLPVFVRKTLPGGFPRQTVKPW